MSKQPHRRSSDITEHLVGEIVAAKPASDTLKNRKDIDSYLLKYFSAVPFEDMAGPSPKIMGRAALAHLEFAKVRKPGQPKLRLFNPSEKQHGYVSAFTIIEMVNDDMPFLVDSVSAAINRHGLAIHMTVHPIFRLTRDARGRLTSLDEPGGRSGREESYIRFVVDREADQYSLDLLEHEITKVLTDVRVAVRDWRKIRDKILEAASTLNHGPADAALRMESDALLRWLAENHFTFLGYREYKLRERGEKQFLTAIKGSGLGVLSMDERGSRTVELTKEMIRHTRSKDPLIITKANSRATVHRHSYLDYIGVKVCDRQGNPAGERRFIGLFTSVAYSESPRNIPLLRLKVERVLERMELDPAGHRGKALTHILDSFPRDELFQGSVQDLVRITDGVLNLQDRRRVKFFMRRDPFRRFYSCIIYVPREKYTTAVRHRVEEILLEEFGSISVDTSVQIVESPLARMHTIVRIGSGERSKFSVDVIETRIAESVVSWQDKLRDQLIDKFGQDEGFTLFREYEESFRPAYETDTTPRIACLDVKRIDGLLKGEHENFLLLHRPESTPEGSLHFRTFRKDEPLPLSGVLPILEDLGTDVYSERPYRVQLKNGGLFWIQDFVLRYENAGDLDIEPVAERFQEGFRQALYGESESDNFNALILKAGLNARQTSLIRCYAKYILQLGIPYSQKLMEEVLVAHADLACKLVRQFELQFDPKLSKQQRLRELETCTASIGRAIARAKSLDEDRILTAFSSAVSCTLRSNYFQDDDDGGQKSYISIKLDSSQLPEVPLPRPKFEIFVYSPRVEGVHLRAGEVARGEIRWSDRREDFRTEVLGLMKAQVVKNTVIVPTGAKGGFVPKRLPEDDRERGHCLLQNFYLRLARHYR